MARVLPSVLTWKSRLVLAILGIAVVLGIINYGGERGKQRQCLDNLRQLWSASMTYANDYDGWLPIYINAKLDKEADRYRVGHTIFRGIESPESLCAVLSPYTSKESAWFCPFDEHAGKQTGIGGIWHATSSYEFMFCQPSVLHSTGLRKGVSKNVMKEVGTPNKYVLISDYLLRTDQAWRGSHPGGKANMIYLDGHIE